MVYTEPEQRVAPAPPAEAPYAPFADPVEADPKGGGRGGVAALPPGALLAYDLVVIFALVVVMWAQAFRWEWIEQVPLVLGDVLPVVVVWAGALGGVVKSLVGLAAHWSEMSADLPQRANRRATRFVDERREWNCWHLTRPWVGAILGAVSTLIGMLVVGTIGATDAGSVTLSNVGVATLAVVSFAVGYQQTAFRQMLERVLDVVIGPGDPTTAGQEPRKPER